MEEDYKMYSQKLKKIAIALSCLFTSTFFTTPSTKAEPTTPPMTGTEIMEIVSGNTTIGTLSDRPLSYVVMYRKNDPRIQQAALISKQDANNSNQVEAEVLEFIKAWGEAWSAKENATEFTRASIEPFYLQTEELLGFDFTDAESRTVFKGVQIHHDTWEAFVRGYDYWTFTPLTESIRVYPQSDNAAAATLYVDNYGRKPDGTEFNARAHATLLLEKQDGNWVIVHENIWGPVNE